MDKDNITVNVWHQSRIFKRQVRFILEKRSHTILDICEFLRRHPISKTGARSWYWCAGGPT